MSKRRKAWSAFFLAATVATMVLIFCFSAQQGPRSQELSDGITIRVARTLRPDFERLAPAAQRSLLERLSVVVRKGAHFAEFSLLGFNLMMYLALRFSSRRPRGCAPLAWLLATFYAMTDELHQFFVSERAPGVLDIAIDSAGGAFGALAAWVVLALLLRLRGGNGSGRDGLPFT